jgi:hypothetical protein
MTRFPRHGSLVLFVLAAALAATATAQSISAPDTAIEAALEVAPPRPADTGARSDHSALLQSLRSSTASREAAGVIVAEVAAGTAALPAGDRRILVGRAAALGAEVSFRGVRADRLTRAPLRLRHGAIQSGENGGFVWNGAVESDGAEALRLRFTGFYLPRNAGLYLWSEQGAVFGPYTGRGLHGDGEFWSHTLRGSTVQLQLRYEGTDLEGALRAARFVIADVGHLSRAFPFGSARPEAGSNLCQENEP